MGALLGLGTAQFGLDYGITNRGGRLPEPAVRAVLAAAAGEVAFLDTAPAYGDAEAVLGRLPEAAGFGVITKTAVGIARPGVVADALRRSLERLRRPLVDGLLVHHGEELLGPAGDVVFGELRALRDQGLVRRIGVSVYQPEHARQLAARFPIEILQLPVSLLDQRVVADGTLAGWRDAGIEVHARSVFLQGLLLSEPERLPRGIDPAPLRACRQRARELALTPRQLAVGFVAGLAGIGAVICGVDAPSQVGGLRSAMSTPVDPALVADLAVHDPDLLDPSRWEVVG